MSSGIRKTLAVPAVALAAFLTGFAEPAPIGDRDVQAWLRQFRNAPREYTVMPFWFWNDDLSEKEILRQIDDFEAHGVYGFVIHPRIGLSEDIGFMSDRYLAFVRLAVEHAARRRMTVHLYDEGMYPSGSACGLVVRSNPGHAARCLIYREIPSDGQPRLETNENLVSTAVLPDGRRIALIDAPSFGKIRGIHFGQDDGEPNQPAAADLLNPEATASFIRHVHEKYHQAVGRHFGKTVRAIFTDEPDMLGRRARRGAFPWTTGLEKELKRILGCDPVPRLSELWFPKGEESERFRRDLRRAVNLRLEETYYAPISRWCEKHNIALTGHPAGPGDIGVQRYFQIPGQDLVWRYVEPGKPSALEGDQSATAKCSSSAAAHLGRKRNGNEVFGAYGWNFTYAEMEWLTNWLFVRGVNQITPHAFYYSLRGKRRDERPPDVGPNSAWWPRYKQYADYARRMSWLLAESRPVIHVAILAESDRLPWGAAKACFENQVDFEYLETRHLLDGTARVRQDGVQIRHSQYKAVMAEDTLAMEGKVADVVRPLRDSGRMISLSSGPSSSMVIAMSKIGRLIPRDICLHGGDPAVRAGIRYRRMRQGKWDVYLLFNEGEVEFQGDAVLPEAGAKRWLLNPAAAEVIAEAREPVSLRIPPRETRLIVSAGQPPGQ